MKHAHLTLGAIGAPVFLPSRWLKPDIRVSGLTGIYAPNSHDSGPVTPKKRRGGWGRDRRAVLEPRPQFGIPSEPPIMLLVDVTVQSHSGYAYMGFSPRVRKFAFEDSRCPEVGSF